MYFNYYNFNDTKMFNPNDIDTKLHKFINNEYRVLIITKAGAEGVDTVNCQNIILFDSQWNDTTSEQIIARAIRFKSHNGLPEKERYVNVIRVMFCFSNDKNIIDDINKGSVDFANLYKQIKDAVKEQLKNIKIEDERYLPTVKELKSLKSSDGKSFIPDETKYEKKGGMYGRLSQLKQISIDGWDKYKDLKTDEDKKSWRIKQYYEWYIENKPINLTVFEYHSVDLWLFIMCKAKQTVINEFIQFFGHGIKLFESYESKFLELLKTKQKSLNRELTEQEKIQNYNENKINETNLLLNSKNIISDIKNERTKQNKLQQFFTNDILAKFIYDYSSIKNNKNDLIKILEPTAGQRDLIKPILEKK